jgi:hypothetical protein
MPLVERKVFIKDPKTNMSIRDKNTHLSAKLAVAPHAKRKIVRIERVEIGGSGWYIYYRSGTAT